MPCRGYKPIITSPSCCEGSEGRLHMRSDGALRINPQSPVFCLRFVLAHGPQTMKGGGAYDCA